MEGGEYRLGIETMEEVEYRLGFEQWRKLNASLGLRQWGRLSAALGLRRCRYSFWCNRRPSFFHRGQVCHVVIALVVHIREVVEGVVIAHDEMLCLGVRGKDAVW
jgi:hypothetical protein